MSTSDNPITNPHQQIQVTGDKQQELSKKIEIATQEQISSYLPQLVLQATAWDLANATDTSHSDSKNFDQKIYLFPESYNALRKEIYEEWPGLWPLVGWSMAFDGPQFVETMNTALETKIQFDSHKVDAMCIFFLNQLRAARGTSTL